MLASTKPANPVSSSSTLWATASKEWVIQPKPKPGRKPKKDIASSPPKEDQLDNKGRRVQNRAAQRAFRERKQSQLAELQARVQSYEQGEIERNVALQSIAKRLKEENDALRLENSLLKEKMLKFDQYQDTSPEHDKKRWRDDTPSSTNPLAHPPNKRSKVSPASPQTSLGAYTPSPPSMASSPDSNGTSDTRFSPLPYETQAESNHSLSNLMGFSSTAKMDQLGSGHGFSTFDCGFCSEDTPCVCREIAIQQAAERMGVVEFKAEIFPHTNSLMNLNQSIRLEPSSPSRTSILENLPAYQPPVPLRRRPAAPPVNPVFPITSLSIKDRATSANCSGDPSNCMACADDAFGKAFCAAIEESFASQLSCDGCPCNQDGLSHISQTGSRAASQTACCPNPQNCDCHSSTTANPLSGTVLDDQSRPDTMPTNDAWRQIKSHPNVAFADLSLLAEVVARSSKCTGPSVAISPALGSITPERALSPSAPTPSAPPVDSGSVLLTDPHARYHEKERERSNGPSSPPPMLVPQDVLIRCGRQKVREVPTDAVQAALRLLDAKFS